MVVPAIVVGRAERYSHVDSVSLFGGDLENHICLGTNVQGLGGVNHAKNDVVIKYELLPLTAVDKSILNELVRKVQFLFAHHSLFVLHHWHCSQFEGERHLIEACLVIEPLSHSMSLLVVQNELVVALSEDDVDALLVLACLLRHHA